MKIKHCPSSRLLLFITIFTVGISYITINVFYNTGQIALKLQITCSLQWEDTTYKQQISQIVTLIFCFKYLLMAYFELYLKSYLGA